MKIKIALMTAVHLGAAGILSAQSAVGRDSSRTDVLVREALVTNPAIRAARQRVEAAQARASTSGLWPDPMLMAGLLNVPVRGAPFGDFMTMKMVGLTQTFPLGGKRGLRRSIAEREVDVASTTSDVIRRNVERDLKSALYELAFIGEARNIVKRNQELLVTFIRIAEGRYSLGLAAQQDVLKAQVEASGLAGTAVELAERERSLRAKVNSLLGRPTTADVPNPAIPAEILRAAVGPLGNIRFESPALGSRVTDSPLPSLAQLQESALRNNPELHVQTAMIASQSAMLDLTRRERIPDVDLSLQYGQRDGYPDMVSATISLPIPLQRRSKQSLLLKAPQSELSALNSDRAAGANSIRADVARLVSQIERERAQLALTVKVILPQSRASLNSSIASYEVGKAEFLAVLDAQATLFRLETDYVRILTDFATDVAELERVTGVEVIQ